MSEQVTKTTAASEAGGNQPRNLYVSVKTFSPEGREVGSRIVDMYHYGTRNWLQNHHWWAMHNGNQVETNVASDDEVNEYLARQEKALQDKYSHKDETAQVAA